jgi:hypothetical protein
MALTLPASIQELVGRRIARISVSWPARDRIIFDTYENSSTQRTRYAYAVGGTVDKFYGLSSMVGYPITSVVGLDQEANGQYKMAIYTEGLNRLGVIYLSNIHLEETRITEEGDVRILETDEESPCLCRITEESGIIEEVVVADVDVGRNPPYKLGPDGRYWVVEEGDVDYGVGLGLVADCGGVCST